MPYELRYIYIYLFRRLLKSINWLSHDIKNKGPLIRWPLGHLVII